MDSLTRVAHAGREIGLALGEPASARADTRLRAIAMLPSLIERAGTCVSIPADRSLRSTPCSPMATTATILVVDSARARSSTAISCSAEHWPNAAIYPAIDLGPSVSRVMTDIAEKEHVARRPRAAPAFGDL
jgi:flagellum-specific ATP synthase